MAHSDLPIYLHKAGGLSKLVTTADAKKDALADGWAYDPPDQQPPDDAADEHDAPKRKPKK